MDKLRIVESINHSKVEEVGLLVLKVEVLVIERSRNAGVYPFKVHLNAIHQLRLQLKPAIHPVKVVVKHCRGVVSTDIGVQLAVVTVAFSDAVIEAVAAHACKRFCSNNSRYKTTLKKPLQPQTTQNGVATALACCRNHRNAYSR